MSVSDSREVTPETAEPGTFIVDSERTVWQVASKRPEDGYQRWDRPGHYGSPAWPCYLAARLHGESDPPVPLVAEVEPKSPEVQAAIFECEQAIHAALSAFSAKTGERVRDARFTCRVLQWTDRETGATRQHLDYATETFDLIQP